MYLYHNTENDLVINVDHIQFRKQIIEQFKRRFSTYGYSEINTPTFENYDLYRAMNGTINYQEMIKTIDNTGQVLVLRPDITIPITQTIANHNEKINGELRYSYALDVYRQCAETKAYRESTQAGVEYFGNTTPEADAEIIALAIHLLQDIRAESITIELGHARFFKQLAAELNLNKADLNKLKTFIQAKNVTEIQFFLKKLNVDKKLQTIVTALPTLYGKPEEVFKQAKELPLNDALQDALQNVIDIYDVLQSYDVSEQIIIDLSLINHMDYYSDMIFQGFIANVGKPILMGGRYNRLADQFDADIPAIGFACDVDLLLTGIQQTNDITTAPVEITVFYDKQSEKKGLQLANHLRNCQYNVLTYVDATDKKRIPSSTYAIEVIDNESTLKFENKSYPFTTDQEILTLLEQLRERE